MIAGFRQISAGLRIMADDVVVERSSPEVMAGILRELADALDRIVDE
jgi:hypothetical protein